ncbi:MFS transporter [Kitasatospora purpeofusca]|uniref:MFS transporter n=1 Tax=Kitasatospora purpeofusca TaxID=67352 RepID=UPI00224E8C22|nr:MFS transporter [Kitasatospora purpeofusca]MCX4754195.1 MFS transporter [Kitasatospora purpeofusca]WSR33632.1 MFS transporter [Kitasatospora purpeofusca]WSR41733.1 MFS transporter [Kitasatospora purpeofusca]
MATSTGEGAAAAPKTWTARFKELPLPLRVLFVTSFVNRAGMFVFPLLAVYLVRSKGLGTAEAGLLISVGSTGLLVGSLLSGPVCDLRGRRDALVAALVLNAVGYLGLGTLDGAPWTYALLLFVALVGMGMFGPAANTLIADLATPEQRPFSYTVSYIGNNLGMGIGPLLGGVAAAYSYHVMFAGNIVVGLLCAVVIRIWVPRDTKSGTAAPKAAGGGRLRFGGVHGHVLWMVLASFFYVAPLIGLEYVLPLAVTTELNASAGLVGVVYTVNSVVVVGLGLQLEKRIASYPIRTLLLVAGVLWALGLAVLDFGFSLAAVLASTVVWTLGEIIASVVVPTYIADHVDEHRVGRFMALNGFVLGLARLVVPFGLGVIWQNHGARPVLHTMLVTPLVGIAVFAVLRIRSSAASAPAASTPTSASVEAGPGPADAVRSGA